MMLMFSKDNDPERAEDQREHERADVSSHPDSFGQTIGTGWLTYPLRAEGAPIVDAAEQENRIDRDW